MPDHGSPFLALPPEVRNTIYAFVVAGEWGTNWRRFSLHRALPTIFLVNKQVRSEALDIFLTQNYFHLYTVATGERWLRILGPEISRLRFLCVCVDRDSATRTLNLWEHFLGVFMERAGGLQELQVRSADAHLPGFMLVQLIVRLGPHNNGEWLAGNSDTPGSVVYLRSKNLLPSQ
ncbi:hypothetical protein F5Y15DRAFT_98644 [Xylariaceae sp. FL0016]|nr:hypothetical protein F5Y15DRAFT_98644 [Xylariaceae sp. FL0016]